MTDFWSPVLSNNDLWVLGAAGDAAGRWLDDQDVALLTAPIRGAANMSGNLGQEVGRPAGSSSGRSFVSGALTVYIPLRPDSVHGVCTVYAITIGDLATMAALSAGAALVTGDLAHGQVETLSGRSDASTASVVGELSVSRYSNVSGNEVGEGDDPILMGAGGLRRAHFSPKSVGYVNERARMQGASVGTISNGGPGS